MANELPINIVMVGTLPPGFTGTPQQLADAIAARLRLQSTQSFTALAPSGATEPSSNAGPWLKDGIEWWVWDNDLGRYRAQTLNLDSVGAGAIPQSKLAVDSVGSAQIIDGAVGTAELADGGTTSAKLAAGAVTSTALAAGILINPRPFRASTVGGSQALATDGVIVDVAFPTEDFDPDGVYNPVTSRFTAAEAGYYQCNYFMQIENDTGQVSTMQIGVHLADGVTNVNIGLGATTSVPSPTGARWFVGSGGLLQLAAGQTVKVRAYATDAVGTGSTDISTNCHWSVSMVKQVIP